MTKTKNAWHIHLMKTYAEMKEKDPSTKFPDAMKAAKKTYSKEE